MEAASHDARVHPGNDVEAWANREPGGLLAGRWRGHRTGAAKDRTSVCGGYPVARWMSHFALVRQSLPVFSNTLVAMQRTQTLQRERISRRPNAPGVWTRAKSTACASWLCLLLGCSEEPPVPVVTLVVSANGSYSLAGQPVAPADLTKQLQSLKSAQPRVELHVLVDRSANYEAVGVAITSAQTAQLFKLKVANLPDDRQ